MTSGESSPANDSGPAPVPDPVSERRAIARKMRGARKREFALLRERMRQSDNSRDTVSGIRGRAALERPLRGDTLEKIARIGAHLEALWNPGAAKPAAALPMAPATAPATPAETPTGPTVSSAWALSRPAATQLLDPGYLSTLLDLPAPLLAPSTVPAAKEELPGSEDPLVMEIAGLFSLRKYAAVQSLLLARLNPDSERNAATQFHVLCLLDTYRLTGDMDGFDDTVLAYVHWWNGLVPSWEAPMPTDRRGPWVLQGDIKGAQGLQLPELDRTPTPTAVDIDCSSLAHMDAAAAHALVQWLVRAQSRNYVVTLHAPSALVQLLWRSLDVHTLAQVRSRY